MLQSFCSRAYDPSSFPLSFPPPFLSPSPSHQKVFFRNINLLFLMSVIICLPDFFVKRLVGKREREIKNKKIYIIVIFDLGKKK